MFIIVENRQFFTRRNHQMEEHKKYIVDFHTHILPGMDDGAGDPAESLSMLYSLASQAVDQV